MIPLIGILLSSFVIALSGALMPGPLLTVAIGESSKKGFWVGPLLILGHAFLELILVIALLAGLAPILNQDTVFGVIAFCGAFILLWLALGMFRSLPGLSMNIEHEQSKGSHLILSGIFLSLANPYWTIWWATIGLGYILHSQTFGLLGVLFFFIGHILADLAWYSIITFSVAKGKRLFSDSFYRRLIATCACFLVVFCRIFWIFRLGENFYIMAEKEKELIVKCPVCKKKTNWKDNTHRPFCSERCRTIDLGAWADSSYSLESEDPPDFEETE